MYCNVERVRLLCGVSSSSVSDSNLEQIIRYATEKVNSDIMKRVVLEKIDILDQYRTNKIDGSNKTFYVNRSWNWYFGDLNDDGKFTVADVEVWDYDSSTDSRSSVTPASIDIRGSFTLTTAPSNGHELYVSYRYCPLKISPTVDPLIADATAYLSGSLSYSKINPADYRHVQIGRLVYKGDVGPAMALHQRYNELVKRIDYMNFEAAKPGIRYYSMDIDNAQLMPDQDSPNS